MRRGASRPSCRTPSHVSVKIQAFEMLKTHRNWLHLQAGTHSEFGNCRGLKIRSCRLTGVVRVYVFVLKMGRWGQRRHRRGRSALFVRRRPPQSKFMWVSGGAREARLGCLWATSPHPPVDWMLPRGLIFPTPSPHLMPQRTTPWPLPAPASSRPRAWGSLLSDCRGIAGAKNGLRVFLVMCGRQEGCGGVGEGGAAERCLWARQFPGAAAAPSRSSDVFTFQNGGKETQALAVHR